MSTFHWTYLRHHLTLKFRCDYESQTKYPIQYRILRKMCWYCFVNLKNNFSIFCIFSFNENLNLQFVEVSSSCVSNGVYFWTGLLERDGFFTEWRLRQKYVKAKQTPEIKMKVNATPTTTYKIDQSLIFLWGKNSDH